MSSKADVPHMYRFCICRCLAHGYVIDMPASFFFCEDPKIISVGNFAGRRLLRLNIATFICVLIPGDKHGQADRDSF